MTNGYIKCTFSTLPVVYHVRDTCVVMCDPGYELIGDEIWTCQSNGSWNGTEAMCGKGTYYTMHCLVSQSTLTMP